MTSLVLDPFWMPDGIDMIDRSGIVGDRLTLNGLVDDRYTLAPVAALSLLLPAFDLEELLAPGHWTLPAFQRKYVDIVIFPLQMVAIDQTPAVRRLDPSAAKDCDR